MRVRDKLKFEVRGVFFLKKEKSDSDYLQNKEIYYSRVQDQQQRCNDSVEITDTADYNCDGDIDILDALLILKAVLNA